MTAMDVMVTGGAGYIGSVIAARLLAAGHRVTVFDDLSRGHAAAVPDGADLAVGDIRDGERLTAAMKAARWPRSCTWPPSPRWPSRSPFRSATAT